MAAKGNSQPKKVNYRDGADGFIAWVEDKVWIKIYPQGSSIAYYVPMKYVAKGLPYKGMSTKEYKKIWDEQKDIARECLKMKKGVFVYRLIILCWMRGEGKSLLACLIQLWKFFCFPNQLITLGANSKEQTKFVHFDIMTDIIRNSPDLYRTIGERNIQTNEIRLKYNNQTVGLIRSISSFSGIVSNITGYTFSEMFDMKNPKFFTQLDGSTRAIPNALGVIDSTVSDKTHILYKMFESSRNGDDPLTFFSYRYSKEGKEEDYWNPQTTQAQLNSYKAKFPFGEFERYFLNLWSAGTIRVFTDELIDSTRYIGADGMLGQQHIILEVLRKKQSYMENIDKLSGKGLEKEMLLSDNKYLLDKMEARLMPIEPVASMKDALGSPIPVTASMLKDLGRMFDTHWCILGGSDRADPMKTKSAARTMFGIVAKGLAGSKSNPLVGTVDGAVPNYLYILLWLSAITDHSTESLKKEVNMIEAEYGQIDKFCCERWGSFDFSVWCEERGIECELVQPTYDRQRTAFSEFFLATRDGRFKAPAVPVVGSKESNILYEEMRVFDHNPDPPRWFGSPEKNEKYGIQDDSMYTIGWAIYGGREMGVARFREIGGTPYFGSLFLDKSLVGAYH